MPAGIPGGYTGWDMNLSPEAHQVFQEVISHLRGVSYTPIAVSSQVVAGINYCFLCQSRGVYPGAQLRIVQLYINQPLPGQGEAHITQVVEVNP